MPETAVIQLFFNFRSPYCYLASKRMFRLIDHFHARFEWRVLGGWNGRSPPERVKPRLPLGRQDMKRWADRYQVPFVPPPPTTEPTRAGAGSLLAEEKGLLREYIIEVTSAEWAAGGDIGDGQVLLAAGEKAGLDRGELAVAMDDPARIEVMENNWTLAQELGVFGVPSFVIGEEKFWGNDRLDFVEEHLTKLGLKK